VSQGYVNRVNVTNTTVNTTTVTNVYNTTIVNKSTTITNVNDVKRNVQGAVTAVPQRAFASAQPVARNAVRVNARDVASGPVDVRAAVHRHAKQSWEPREHGEPRGTSSCSRSNCNR
jgi:hypothetical protein